MKMISSAQGCMSCMSSMALTPLGEHCAKRHPKDAIVCACPERSCTVGSKALLIHPGGTRKMAEFQQITLFRTVSPIYITVDIIKQDKWT
jgi:hypothetical protein